MNCEEIKKKIILLCAEIFQNSSIDANLIEYVDFVDDLGMDSLTFITLIVEIETKFDITIPDELLFMENFRCLENIVKVAVDLLIPAAGGGTR